MDSSRMGKCGRKRDTTPSLDQKIKAVALQNRRASCKSLSMELAHEGIMVTGGSSMTIFWNNV